MFDLAEPRQRLAPHERLPRHRHAGAYAALVLSGGYSEAWDSGRRQVSFGEVVFHRAFEAHAEARTHAAFHRLTSSSDSFAAIAADTGFADLPHLCRAVTALTGRPPGHWRIECSR